jgi:DNA-binding transcriptional regulator YdaS (Cro superfamily)
MSVSVRVNPAAAQSEIQVVIRGGSSYKRRTSRLICDSRWRTRFGQMVRRYGVGRMARDLGVDPGSVYQWVRGCTSPRPDKAVAIIALVRSLGRLRLAEIYEQRRGRTYADQNTD